MFLDAQILAAVIASVTTIVVTFVSYLLKLRYDTKKKATTTEDRIRRDNILYSIISELKTRFAFDRVMIYMFHNGSSYYTGEAMQKVSVAFETTKSNVRPIAHTLQNIPAGIFNRLLNCLLSARSVSIPDTDQETDDHFRNLLSSYDIKSYYAIRIEDDRGWNGILACEYHTLQNHHLEDDDLEYIVVQTARISTLLKLTNKYYDWRQLGRYNHD